MKIRSHFLARRASAWLLLLFCCTQRLWAATGEPAPTWHAQSLFEAIAYMTLFSAIGITVAIAGYKLFDKLTPGDLHREILENRNVAAAIVAGAVILGLCLIVAAAMIG